MQPTSPDSSWYMDTGATSHMTNSSGHLSSISFKGPAHSIIVGNGGRLATSEMVVLGQKRTTTQKRTSEEEERESAAAKAKEMVKFLKPGKAVILLQGRYAGRKAVIVRSFDDGVKDRHYGHCLVAGISKYPKKVIRKDSQKKQAKKSRVKCFVKLVNYNHIMPTRYTLDVDLKEIVTVDSLQSRDKKVAAAKETKAKFEERFKTGKNRWFFSKLRF